MKFTTSLSHGLLLSLFLLGASCATTPTPADVQITISDQQNTVEIGDWYPTTKGPWDGSIHLATSPDGLTFTGNKQLFTQAGVPNLLLLQDGTLVLLYQYFSDTDQTMFDVIAYSVSKDQGNTWTDTQPVTMTGLPDGLDADKNPMDPTLVQLADGRLRLYFTYHAQGNKTAALYSATSTDDQLDGTFVVDATPALITEAGHLLDPAVVYFNGAWQHYTWQDTSDDNYHSTSADGTEFTLQDSVNLPMDFLGQLITTDDGLRFYGTGKGAIVTAVSTDGNHWTMEAGQRLSGADPGVQRLEDGSYLMVYTSMSFN